MEKDVYEIYSRMLSDAEKAEGSNTNPRLLIEATTGSAYLEETCIHPPSGFKERYGEILSDFQQRQETPRTLRRAFSSGKPYVLLGKDAAYRFRMRSPTNEEAEAFSGVIDLFTLSDVYFDQKRTLALVGISSWCGNVCGMHQWKLFAKQADATWNELPGAACSTIARTARPRAGIAYSELLNTANHKVPNSHVPT